jgi:hypothetical protein
LPALEKGGRSREQVTAKRVFKWARKEPLPATIYPFSEIANLH